MGKKTPAKILWLKGKAIGYFTYTSSFRTINKPCIHQIYVSPEYRRKGFGQALFEDFLNTFKGREVMLEEPVSQEILNLLLKLGLCVKDGENYKSTGRISFISGGL